MHLCIGILTKYQKEICLEICDMKILIVSNMYPSKKDTSFGTFIKVFEHQLQILYPTISIKTIAIRGRSKSKIKKVFKYAHFYLGLLGNLLLRQYDIIYVHTITYPTPAIRIASIFKKLNIIFNVHGVDVLTKSRVADCLKRLCSPLLRNCKYLVVPSTYFREVVLEKLPMVSIEKIIVSPSGGINRKFFHEKDSPFNKIVKIGFVSRITKGKGWKTFIDAVRILDEKGFQFNAVLVGSGDQENDLKQLIENVKFTGDNTIQYVGALGHKELYSFYQDLDVFVFPSESESESLGLVGLEAMASGVPVIGSNIGGISTYVKDGLNGFLFNPSDSRDLSNCIIKFINLSGTEKLKLSKEAYNTAFEYESEKVTKKLFNKIFNSYE